MQGSSQLRAFRIPLAIVCSTRQPLGMNHSHRPKIPTPFIHERVLVVGSQGCDPSRRGHDISCPLRDGSIFN